MAAEVMATLTPQMLADVVREADTTRLAPILNQLPPDDLVDFIGKLDEELSAKVTSLLTKDSKEDLEDLLQYDPNSAGGIMTTDYFTMTDDSRVEQAVEAIRSRADMEDVGMVYYIYVTNNHGRLMGVVSLRQLLLAHPAKLLRDVMNPRIISARTSDSQETVAKLVDKYRLLAIPVVDDTGELCGIVTVDDLIHVIQDADTQAMIKQATGRSGDSKLNIMTKHFVEVARGRLPWLAVPFLGGLAAAYILSYFEHTMAAVIQLSFFMPMIFGMAGNVGSQAATVAVRGLATRTIHVRDWTRLLIKEISVGMLIGGFYALCLSSYAYLVFDSSTLAFVVGISILSNITYAGVIAARLPLLIQRLGHDPAIGGGPYVLTAIDVLGVINYLFIATTVYQL